MPVLFIANPVLFIPNTFNILSSMSWISGTPIFNEMACPTIPIPILEYLATVPGSSSNVELDRNSYTCWVV